VELKQIKELMAAMERAGLKKLSIKETTGFELSLEREVETPSFQVYHASRPIVSDKEVERHAPPPAIHHPPVKHAIADEHAHAPGKYVTSPMVGTYYSAPSPDDPHFVKVGDRVDENTVVCIVEAMKVMNEVKAGVSGVVAEICVENGHPVEFGTKIIRIT
jgi:acetyl-CoA carboxylase biotin carboxyl carrier protein